MKKTLSLLKQTIARSLVFKTGWLYPLATVLTLLTAISNITYAEEPQNKPYYLPDIENKRSQLLLEHMHMLNRENEVVMLDAEESFYGLFLAEETGNPQGAVLILPDIQQHGHWPKIIAPLREYLPRFGWATLSIELPYPPAKVRISRDQGESEETPKDESEETTEDESEKIAEATTQDNTQETAGETTPASTDAIAVYQQKMRTHINAAINYLKSRNQLNLVIVGYGASASWAIDYAHQQTGKGLTLITIDALNNAWAPENIQQQIEKIQVPYLDLIHPDQQLVQRLARQRLKIMRTSGTNQYQQITTANIANYKSPENSTTRRIRGWLMTNAGGKKINRAR